MRVYIETGTLIDYLAQGQYALLRSAPRNGRPPAQLYADALEVLNLLSEPPLFGAISAFSFYEAEETLFKDVRFQMKGQPNANKNALIACRPILSQALLTSQLFRLKTLGLSRNAAINVSNSTLMSGVRAADALHVQTAAIYKADIIISADGDILRLDGMIHNRRDVAMRCVDTDDALALLREYKIAQRKSWFGKTAGLIYSFAGRFRR